MFPFKSTPATNKRLQRACVIIVENLAVPFDRRVWQEACALKDANWRVSVICPKSDEHPLSYEMIDDIAIYRHSLPLEAKGKLAFVLEYGAALFHEFRLLLKVFRERGFDVIQACNPPDLIFIVALPFKLFGKAFVFDHHDPCPELFAVKFGRKGRLHQILQFLERRTLALADIVIATNETCRELAVQRGGKKPSDVVTVYSTPNRKRIRRVPADESLRGKHRLILGYVGIIGVQDGVDHLVLAVVHLIKTLNVRDFVTVVVGDGPALPAARLLARELAIEEHIIFTGYLSGDELLRTLSSFDIGIIPDPYNEYNDIISMNKVFEYATLGVPIVAYDLKETRRLVADGGVFAETRKPDGLASAIKTLIDDESLRSTIGRRAALRADQQFDWEADASRYVNALDRAFLASKAGQAVHAADIERPLSPQSGTGLAVGAVARRQR